MKENVLIIFSNLEVGGAQVQMLNILNNISCDRFYFYICCLKSRGKMAEIYENSGFKVYSLNMKSKYSIHRLIHLFFIILKLKITIVNTQGGGDSLFWGRLIGYLCRVKRIVSTLHTTGNFPGGKLPVSKLNRYLPFINNYYICVCKNQSEYYQKNYNFNKSSIRVIYNGVKVKRVNDQVVDKLKNKLLVGGNKKTVCIVAALEEHKNHKMFLDAAAEIVKKNINVLFMIIGDGSLKNFLVNYAKEKNIKNNVKFLGYKSNVLEYIRMMDVVALTSRTEAFPVCLLEAMSQAKPIITTRVGGIPEMIQNGENGFLVEVDDYMDLSEKIIRILKNPVLGKKMGETSFEVCKKYFDIKDKADEFVNLLSSLDVK